MTARYSREHVAARDLLVKIGLSQQEADDFLDRLIKNARKSPPLGQDDLPYLVDAVLREPSTPQAGSSGTLKSYLNNILAGVIASALYELLKAAAASDKDPYSRSLHSGTSTTLPPDCSKDEVDPSSIIVILPHDSAEKLRGRAAKVGVSASEFIATILTYAVEHQDCYARIGESDHRLDAKQAGPVVFKALVAAGVKRKLRDWAARRRSTIGALLRDILAWGVLA